MSEINYNKGQVAGKILGQRCKELQAKYDTLKASHTRLVEACKEGLAECERTILQRGNICPDFTELSERLSERIIRIEQALTEAEKL
jgi:hypothetical protein